MVKTDQYIVRKIQQILLKDQQLLELVTRNILLKKNYEVSRVIYLSVINVDYLVILSMQA